MTVGDQRRPAMQSRCVNCKREQYAPAIWDFSHGAVPCWHCNYTSKAMTIAEYREAMRTHAPEPHEDQR